MIQNLSFLRFKNIRIRDNIRYKIIFNIKITNINFTTLFQDWIRI